MYEYLTWIEVIAPFLQDFNVNLSLHEDAAQQGSYPAPSWTEDNKQRINPVEFNPVLHKVRLDMDSHALTLGITHSFRWNILFFANLPTFCWKSRKMKAFFIKCLQFVSACIEYQASLQQGKKSLLF